MFKVWDNNIQASTKMTPVQASVNFNEHEVYNNKRDKLRKIKPNFKKQTKTKLQRNCTIQKPY